MDWQTHNLNINVKAKQRSLTWTSSHTQHDSTNEEYKQRQYPASTQWSGSAVPVRSGLAVPCQYAVVWRYRASTQWSGGAVSVRSGLAVAWNVNSTYTNALESCLVMYV